MGGSSLGHCGAGLQEAISGARGGPVYPISALHHTPLHQHWLHFSHCHYQPPCKDAPQNGLIHNLGKEGGGKAEPYLLTSTMLVATGELSTIFSPTITKLLNDFQ